MPLLHVTSIFPTPDFPIPEEALYRGRYVHATTALLDQGKRLAEPIYEPWRGFVEAWELAKRELRIGVVEVEKPMEDKRRGYCGTPDRRVQVKARRGMGTIDLKCDTSCSGAVPWWVGLQTAAYVGEGKDWRGACVLHPDGSYRWRDQWTDPDIFQPGDFREFCARLFVFQRDIARGLREMPAAREE